MKYYIECECSSTEHIARLELVGPLDFDPEPVLYLSVHLSNGSFVHRLWRGIKYIFGYRCRYGDFDEVILTKETAKGIIEICQKYIDMSDK